MDPGTPNFLLIAAAAIDLLAALLHLGCIAFGAPWYRFFGAGERMAELAMAGSRYPTLISCAIAGVLTLWAAYALSAAGVIPRLPLLRLGLCAITALFLLRGIAGIPLAFRVTAQTPAFWWWSSAICLAIGLIHLGGLLQVWPRL